MPNDLDKVEVFKTKIMNQLNFHSVVMPTSIVASIILMNRKGINEQMLVSQSSWLANELIKRNKKIGSLTKNSSLISIRNTIKFLSHAVIHKKDMFGLSISVKSDYKNILLLSYYRYNI